MRTPKEKTMAYKKIADSKVGDFPLPDIVKNAQNSVSRGSLPVKKSDLFQKARLSGRRDCQNSSV